MVVGYDSQKYIFALDKITSSNRIGVGEVQRYVVVIHSGVNAVQDVRNTDVGTCRRNRWMTGG